MKPPDIEKEEKQAKANLQRLINYVRSQWSFKRIKTFGDYLAYLGHTDDYIRNTLNYRQDELGHLLTLAELKEHLDGLRISLDVKWYLKKNWVPEPIALAIEPIIQEGYGSSGHDHNSNYGLPPSPKEKCSLFWFQKKYAKNLLDGIVIHHKKAQLLIAQAGHGKTFILGAMFRRLLDMEFHKGKTISPWPYFYITKASVVEQTRRVLTDKFGINTVTEVMVTNYDQLRATLGTLYLQEKSIIVNNEPTIIWEWRPQIHPVVFAIDECQAAKNQGSTQTEIITAISNINNPYVYCVYSSATPFTRIIEARSFVLNCRLDSQLF